MSTEPLLPSYNSTAQQNVPENGPKQPSLVKCILRSVSPLVEGMVFVTLLVTAIISTVWASRSYSRPDDTPPKTAPLLPYFAILCLSISSIFWLGYLVYYAVTSSAKYQVVMWTSVIGRVALLLIHVGIARWYKLGFPESAQLSWKLTFLSSQAWWDFVLFWIYLYLLDTLPRENG
ncbi:hypothetical protein BJY04DRAFT_222002 [Aspergillus karnatakaensis]|uniref:uncharacterized protein n=1 Tax=Aspergillus karnatakaensis TaxID=1810916 RepID=UPI003CCD6A0E